MVLVAYSFALADLKGGSLLVVDIALAILYDEDTIPYFDALLPPDEPLPVL